LPVSDFRSARELVRRRLEVDHHVHDQLGAGDREIEDENASEDARDGAVANLPARFRVQGSGCRV
jgi:hypothetical protein